MNYSNTLPAAILAAVLLPGAADAANVQLRVTVESLVPANSIAFAPLRLGFHSGAFDAFNLGETATAPIISVAEGGSGADWFPAFTAADPGAVLGSVLPDPAGPLVPGATGTAVFDIDTSVNRYFTFAAMAVPSNDFFIGNDDPLEYELFDGGGALALGSITVLSNEIWDAGSEIFDPAAAAFLPTGTNALRQAQDSVVAFNFAELAAFNGLTTAAGYVFDSQLAANQAVYRINFETVGTSPVPVPAALPLLLSGAGVFGLMRRRAS